MTNTVVETVWEAMHGRIGEDLRFVIQYDRLDVDSKVRDDVASLYTESEGEDLVQETIVDQMSEVELGRKRKSGDLEAVVRVFEDASIVSWIDHANWKCGVSVSIDRDGSVATIADVQACVDLLSEEIQPDLKAA